MRVLLALLLVATTPVKPKPIVLHERGEQMVCAEYTVPSDQRQPNRSCVDAAQVRAWILQNGRPADECER